LQLAVDGIQGPTLLIYVKAQLGQVGVLRRVVASRLPCRREFLELSPEVIQPTVLLVELAPLTVNGPEGVFPEPHDLLPALDGASRKDVLSSMVQDL
jgi:hypothetical protein